MSESLTPVEWLARYDQAARPAVCPAGDPHAHDIDGKLINATVRCVHGYSTNLEMPPLDVEQLRAALKELEQLRAQVADFPDQLADAQEVALDKLVEAFGEGWDNCRLHLEDEARLKRGVAVTQYSNQLPWPTYAALQQSGLDALCVRDAMADAAMRQPESGAAK